MLGHDRVAALTYRTRARPARRYSTRSPRDVRGANLTRDPDIEMREIARKAHEYQLSGSACCGYHGPTELHYESFPNERGSLNECAHGGE